MPVVSAPEWFVAALAAPREEDEVEVEGTPIHSVRWGTSGRPGIVLVHGGAAHAHWWDHVVPMLAAGVLRGRDRPIGPRRQWPA